MALTPHYGEQFAFNYQIISGKLAYDKLSCEAKWQRTIYQAGQTSIGLLVVGANSPAIKTGI